MTDILLINPASTTILNTPIPFGISYLAAFLEENGFSVKILDLSVQEMSDEDMLDYIGKIRPRKVGLSCMSVHVDFVRRISEKIKMNFKSIQIIVGGTHPTALPEQSADSMKDADIFVLGEGEITLLELMKNKKLEKINGIAYRRGGKLKINACREFIQNLDTLPFPARHLLPDIKKYTLGFDWEGRRPAATIFSSRGCPYNCIYCASKIMWKRRVRFRSAENVLEEIDFLVKKHNVKEILFYDDHFVLDKKRLEKICQGIIKRGYDLTWCCLSRVDCFDLKTARLMRKAGCHMISFGVESGSQKILDNMEKNVKIRDIINAFNICKTAGINTKASFIFGAPGENYESVKETRDLLKKILPDYVWFFIMTPFPGTKLYTLHQEHGLASEEWARYDQTTYDRFYETELSYTDFRKIVSDSYKEYYLSWAYIFSQIKNLNLRKIKIYLSLIKKLPLILGYIKKGKVKNEG